MHQRRGDERETEIGEWQLRLPYSRSAELRIGIPSHLLTRELERKSGFDDLFLEIKLSGDEKASFGLFLNTFVPTGSRRVAQRKWQPGATRIGDFSLSEKLDLVANLGAVRALENDVRFTQYNLSASLDFETSQKSSVFVELSSQSRLERDARAQKTLGTGGFYRINSKTSLDLHAGVGLHKGNGGPDYFLGAGFARLF